MPPGLLVAIVVTVGGKQCCQDRWAWCLNDQHPAFTVEALFSPLHLLCFVVEGLSQIGKE